MRKALSIFFVLFSSFFAPTYALSLGTSRVIKSLFINRDTVWEGNILVDGLVKVSAGVTLRLMPGTKVRFAKRDHNNDGVGDSGLFLQGNILAFGTAKRPIIFTSGSTKKKEAGDWAGINIIASDTSENILSNVIIEYANAGIHSHFSTLSLQSATFRKNRRGLYCQEMRLNVSSSKFVDNISGVRCRDLTGTITKTIFKNNIWGMDCRRVVCVWENCEFSVNAMYGLRVRESDGRITAALFSSNRFGARFQDSVIILDKVKALSNFESGVSFKGGRGEITDSYFEKNGLEGISGKNVSIFVHNSSFTANLFGIRCSGYSNLFVENSLFSENGEGIGMNTNNKQGSFYGNGLKIKSNGLGCRFTHITSFYIDKSEIINNGKEGVKAKKSSGTIRNTVVTGNMLDGVSLSDSNISLQASVMSANKGWGVYALRSHSLLSDIRINKNSSGGFKGLFGQVSVLRSTAAKNMGTGYYFEQCKVLVEESSAKENNADGVALSTSVVSMKNFISENNMGWGVREENSRLLFELGSLIENGMGGFLSEETENSHVTHSTFRNNVAGGWFCDSCEETYFAFNTIENNKKYGVQIKDASPVIHANAFLREESTLIMNSEADIDVSDNFWGTVNEVQIEKGIVDVLDNSGNGAAQYIPYLNNIPKENYERTEKTK